MRTMVRMESNILLSGRYLGKSRKFPFVEIVSTSNKLNLFAGWHLSFQSQLGQTMVLWSLEAEFPQDVKLSCFLRSATPRPYSTRHSSLRLTLWKLQAEQKKCYQLYKGNNCNCQRLLLEYNKLWNVGRKFNWLFEILGNYSEQGILYEYDVCKLKRESHDVITCLKRKICHSYLSLLDWDIYIGSMKANQVVYYLLSRKMETFSHKIQLWRTLVQDVAGP